MIVGAGAVTRRPGLVYVAQTASNNPARLMPFVYSESDAYVMELTAGKIRFYRSGGQVLDGNDPYEISTSYTADELFEIQGCQIKDVMYLVQGEHFPQELTRSGHTSWTITDANITNGPFRDENTTSTTIEVNDVNETVTVIADANIFDEDHVGSLWRLRHTLATQTVSGTFSSVATSSSVVAGTGSNYTATFTDAAFKGSVQIQVSYDEGDNWRELWTATNPVVLALSEDVNEISDFGQNVLMRVACTSYTSGSADYELSVASYTHVGVIEMTGYTDANEMTATVLDRIGSTDATTRWSEGAWSDYRGYPTAVANVGGRVVYGQGTSLYFSGAGASQVENFAIGTNDNDPFQYTPSRSQQDTIRWMYADKSYSLLIGTLGSVMAMSPGVDAVGFYASNPPVISSASEIGCKERDPAVAGSAVLFLDRTGKRLHEIIYDYEQTKITSPPLTIMASHISGSGFQQMAWQETPFPTLWCVRDDGQMATLYYDRPYQIAGWSRQVTDGDFTSVAVVPATGQDRVWCIVNRTVDSNSVYYVEYFDDYDPDRDLVDCTYLDCMSTYDGGAAVSISAITKADPAVVTVASWPSDLTDGDHVKFLDVGGMTELNYEVFTVADANESGLTFSLSGWDTSSYTTYTSGGTVQIVAQTLTGLDQWEGESIDIFADGAMMSDVTVSGGSVTIDDYANTVVAGKGFTSTLSPLRADVTSNQASSPPFGKTFRGLWVDFYCASGAKYGLDADHLKPFPWSYTDGVRDLISGSKTTPPFGGDLRDAEYQITSEEAFPMTIRNMVYMVEVQ
jgi:hypothetical protein